MKLKLKENYSDRLKAGDIVEIDAIKVTKHCGSGLMVRTVTTYKDTLWLDLGWFETTKRQSGLFAYAVKE